MDFGKTPETTSDYSSPEELKEKETSEVTGESKQEEKDLEESVRLGNQVCIKFKQMGLSEKKIKGLINLSSQTFSNIQKETLQDVERDFIVEYLESTSDTKKTKRLADKIRENGKLDDKLNGNKTDWRRLAKKIKRERKESQKEAKYAVKAWKEMCKLIMYNTQKQGILGDLEAMEHMDFYTISDTYHTEFAGICSDMGIGVSGVNREAVFKDKDLKKGFFNTAGGCAFYTFCCARGAKIPSKFVPPFLVRYNQKNPSKAASIDQADGSSNLVRNVDGSRDIEGISRMTDDLLLALFVSQKNTAYPSPEGLENADVSNDLISHRLIKRSITPGGGFDLVTAITAKGVDKQEAQLMAKEALVGALRYDRSLISDIRTKYHDQVDTYWQAKRKHTGNKYINKSMDDIPKSDKERMFSRAVVRGLIAGYNFPNTGVSTEGVEDVLSKIFTEDGNDREQEGRFVKQSSQIVGESMVGLVDGIEGKGYALSKLNIFKDIGSLDNLLDKTYEKGVTGTAGDMIGQLIGQIPGVNDGTGRKMGNGLATIAKIGGVLWAGKKLIDWFSEGDGFLGKSWRAGAIVGGAMLFGSDVKTLLFGGNGGIVLDGLKGLIANEDDFEGNGISSLPLLNFAFGDLTIKEIMDLVEVEEGRFVIRESVGPQLMSMGLAEEQKELIEALVNDKDAGISLMLHEGLHQAGITTENHKQKLSEVGNTKFKNYLSNTVQLGVLANAMGRKLDAATKDQLETTYRSMTQAEQKLFTERAQTLETKTVMFERNKVFLRDHLLVARRPLVDKMIGEDNAEDLINGFAADDKIQILREQFVSGEGDFDKDVSLADNEAKFDEKMEELFNHSDYFESFVMADDAADQIEVRLKDGTEDTDAKPITSLEEKTWFLNRKEMPYEAEHKYPEITLNTSSGEQVMLGIEKNGSNDSSLVFWLPDSAGAWQKWKLRTIGSTPANIVALGWGSNSKAFEMYMFDESKSTYESHSDYTFNIINTIVGLAESDSTEGQLSSTTDYAGGNGGNEMIKIERLSGGDRE